MLYFMYTKYQGGLNYATESFIKNQKSLLQPNKQWYKETGN